jgi:hypothetical protein
VTEVQVGEVHGASVEILGGLEPGAVVVGQGAILLKPVLQEALRDLPPSARGES